jgi:tetratricopeptide (TPR) repeat protein
MIKTTIFLSILMMGQMAFGQIGGNEFKLRGLELLNEGQTDSAMVYLNQAVMKGVADGEVLGGLALAYMQKGDAQRALENAVEARKDKQHPSADAYLAGVLAHEAMGNVSQRDRWLDQGLKAFPADYLLLYHAGRITIPFDSEEGERMLLRSIHAYPAFGAAHLLLGEHMYRRGENLKATLPLMYYLLLHQDALNSGDVVALIERLYDSWSFSNESVSKVSKASKGFTIDYIPTAYSGGPNDKGEWFVAESLALMQSVRLATVSSSDALWVFYSDFFGQVARLGFDVPLAHHMAYSRYPGEAMEWINDNSQLYQLLGDWLMVQ